MNRFDASLLWNSVADDSADDSCELEEPASYGTFDESCDESDGECSSVLQSAPAGETFFVPLSYEPNYRYPLIVWLHSDGFNENQVCHVMPHVSTRNYLGVGVRGTQAIDAAGHRFDWHSSSAAMDVAQRRVLHAVRAATSKYSVHPDRIVLAGYQRGGTMAMQIAMRNPEMFAAAISLGGTLGRVGGATIDLDQLRQRRLPMLWQWSIQGDHYSQETLVKEIQFVMNVRSQIEIRQYRNDDEMNTVVLSDLNQWVMDHVVGGAPVAKINPWDSSPTSFSEN
ncbi:alpha/beta hydrolase [Roseiconus nitratireducens]|nr:alpha/beta hydrolase-fold protein [Roseiconus nitratireducens]